MLGAIIGDVAGSIYEVLEVNEIKNGHRSYEERIKILDKNVDLFNEDCSVTDDSILTCAIARAIISKSYNYEKCLRKYGHREIDLGIGKYGRSRFGKGFVAWLKGDYQGDSFGNGAAMRISSVGYLFDTLDEVRENARMATIPSHNHPDAIKGAEAVAVTIFLLRKGYSKEEVYKYVTDNYYDLDYDLEELQHNNKFSSKSSITVPQALFIFFKSNDFDDAIRKAISIGGDADTIACIVGSISEAYYGVPDELKRKVKDYLPEYVKTDVEQFYGNLAFNSFMEEEEMNDKEFRQYISSRIKIYPGTIGKEWFGCFPIVSDDGKLTDIKLLVPEIDSFDNLLVNIHEFTHAYELFHELGSIYEEDREDREARASAKEKEFTKRFGDNCLSEN